MPAEGIAEAGRTAAAIVAGGPRALAQALLAPGTEALAVHHDGEVLASIGWSR